MAGHRQVFVEGKKIDPGRPVKKQLLEGGEKTSVSAVGSGKVHPEHPGGPGQLALAFVEK